MQHYIILSETDMQKLNEDKPIYVNINGTAYEVISSVGFDKENDNK